MGSSIIRRVVSAALRRFSPDLYQTLKIGQYARTWVLPRPTTSQDSYLPSEMLGLNGIPMDLAAQLQRLGRWEGERYQTLFRRLREDAAINKGVCGQAYGTEALHNGYYPTPDAEIYAAMILDLKPSIIVEVGSGFSTLIARHAIAFGNLKTRLTVIDPNPRTDVGPAADEIVRRTVEESDLEQREWPPGSLLFIDSTHICRTRGDLPLLFCKVLPKLPVGTVVHAHDIFLPYDYPTKYDPLCYTEQYMLHCMLCGSARYRTLFATHHLSRAHPQAMQRVFGPRVGSDPLFNGGSYWLQVVPNEARP